MKMTSARSPGGSGFADPGRGVGGKEPGVFDAVVLRVADGIVHRIPVELHAHHLLCPVGGSQADGADAAVGIQHDLSAGQLGGLHGQTVEHRRLHRVHLIEAAGAERVGLAAEFIQNEPLAVEHLFSCSPSTTLVRRGL